MKVDPKIASDIIRGHLNQPETTTVDPIEVHRQVYLTQVCQILNLEPNPHNLKRVTSALDHFCIETDNFQEWPKHVDGRVVHSQEERTTLPEPDEMVEDEAPVDQFTERQTETDRQSAIDPQRELA